MIFISKDKLVWIRMFSMIYLLSFQASEKLDLEVLEIWLFIELYILECFLTSFSNMQELP